MDDYWKRHFGNVTKNTYEIIHKKDMDALQKKIDLQRKKQIEEKKEKEKQEKEIEILTDNLEKETIAINQLQ